MMGARPIAVGQGQGGRLSWMLVLKVASTFPIQVLLLLQLWRMQTDMDM